MSVKICLRWWKIQNKFKPPITLLLNTSYSVERTFVCLSSNTFNSNESLVTIRYYVYTTYGADQINYMTMTLCSNSSELMLYISLLYTKRIIRNHTGATNCYCQHVLYLPGFFKLHKNSIESFKIINFIIFKLQTVKRLARKNEIIYRLMHWGLCKW